MDETTRTDRRRFLRRGAITAAVAAAGGAALAKPAAANDGNNIVIGALNTNTAGSTNSTRLNGATDGVPMLSVLNTQVTGTGVPSAIQGTANGISGIGVDGVASSVTNSGGIGVQGSSDMANGVGVLAKAGNGAALRLHDSGQAIPPSSGNWTKGSLVVSTGQLWYCYVDGTGGGSQWLRLSSPFLPFALPFRVFDSRPGQPNPSMSPQGVFNVGAPGRTIDCLPAGTAGATAILFNVTLANMIGNTGSVLVWINGGSEPTASSINWSAGQASIANAVTSTCDINQRVQVKCTTGVSTHVILDVIGYYP